MVNEPYSELFPADVGVSLDMETGRLRIDGDQQMTDTRWTCWEDSPNFEHQVRDWDLSIAVSLLRIEHDLAPYCRCRPCEQYRKIRHTIRG